MTPALDAVRREELHEIDALLIRLTGAAVGYGSISDPDAQRELLRCQSSILAAVEVLLARIAELEAGPKVKPLEWDGCGAETPFGSYDIGRTGRYWAVYLNRDLVAEPANEEVARIAAQADYESRILGALLPKASVREERR